MPAKFIRLGEPAHDAERSALRFLVDGLPGTFTVYGNAFLVERSGVVHELDAVIVAPHANFVVEIKSHRGAIEGTDHDWWVPQPMRSPLPLNRKTAQILRSLLKNQSYDAGQVWTEGLVFLSQATSCGVRGPASKDRIHTRKTILAALQTPSLTDRLAGRPTVANTPATEAALDHVLRGDQHKPRSLTRRVREYEIVSTLETHDTCQEMLARHTLTGDERVLRVYAVPPLLGEDERERIVKRARWEAQVLGRLGKIEGILSADPPFQDEVGMVLPLEHFAGVSLATWVDRLSQPAKKVPLPARIQVWRRIARALDDAHAQGVVHRLLRPEVVLVEDKPAPTAVRVTGFDLAKQLGADSTAIGFTRIGDDRLRFAAPEVVQAFSSAEPASDQFSLGALLAFITLGRPLFESTRDLLAARRLSVRMRDVMPSVSQALDEAVGRMLALRPADRFPTLGEALQAVEAAVADRQPSLPATQAQTRPIDIENLHKSDRIGTDYEVIGPLGQGGLSVVYAARHLPSGSTRALKIARPGSGAEDALRGEFQALSRLDHPAIVRVRDLSNVVDGHLTLIMERVGGETLRSRLQRVDTPLDPATRRRYAENLLAALDYLEQQGVTHKDLKPDNLLVGAGGLTVIDFSLADMPADAAYGGTALYRDPSRADWTHATDRYAAALCLFELYVGRHAFDGKVPQPGQPPSLSPEDVDPPGLFKFFDKALDQVPEKRFPSARAMRDTFLVALGHEVPIAAPDVETVHVDAATSLRATPLPARAINQLARTGVTTVGELLGLSEAQLRSLSNLGEKTVRETLAFQAEQRGRGLAATAPPSHVEPAIVPDLVDSPEPLSRLTLPAAIRRALEKARLTTIGTVARLPRSVLKDVAGMGPARLVQTVESLLRFRDQDTGITTVHTLDSMWEQAVQPLSDAQRVAVERFVGVGQDPQQGIDVARELGVHGSTISTNCKEGLERLHDAALADVVEAVEQLLDAQGGLALVESMGARLEEQWLAERVRGAGLVRLLVKTHNTRLHDFEVDGVDGRVLARPAFARDAVRAYVREVERLAKQWPPIDASAARRALGAALPEFVGDPLQLATRLCTDVEFTDAGELFLLPLQPPESVGFVLAREREGLPLAELEGKVRQVFGERCTFPDPDHLLGLLRELEYQVKDGRIEPAGSRRPRTKTAPPPLAGDAPWLPPGGERSPELALRELLRDAAKSRGFRMLVAPPEKHLDIGRSVALALGGQFVSFEDAFFRRHGADLAALERAEQYVAQRGLLTEYADDLLRDLVEDHGQPGRVTVLGDTALLDLCDALDVPRRLYDETASGALGLWVLVVPGVIHKRQPLFNEHKPLWHLEGVTFPLLEVMPLDGQEAKR